jgi:hypothetical protein
MHSQRNKDFYMINPLGACSSSVERERERVREGEREEEVEKKKGKKLCKPIIPSTLNKTLTKPNSVQKTLLHSIYQEHKCHIQEGVHKYSKNLKATSKFQALQK